MSLLVRLRSMTWLSFAPPPTQRSPSSPPFCPRARATHHLGDVAVLRKVLLQLVCGWDWGGRGGVIGRPVSAICNSSRERGERGGERGGERERKGEERHSPSVVSHDSPPRNSLQDGAGALLWRGVFEGGDGEREKGERGGIRKRRGRSARAQSSLVRLDKGPLPPPSLHTPNKNKRNLRRRGRSRRLLRRRNILRMLHPGGRRRRCESAWREPAAIAYGGKTVGGPGK